MKIDKFNNFIVEKSSSDIEIEYIGEKNPNSLVRDFERIEIREDDVEIFCRYNSTVSVFELKIPHNFQTDLEMLLSDYVRGVNNLHVENYDNVNAYWIDMGNGLNSIAIEYEEMNTSNYKIYSGDNDLTLFLKNDLEDILVANKYNL